MRGNMTETNEVEKIFVHLSKKIDDQARFTRSVSVICTLLILGVMFYTSTSLISVVPQLIVAHIMGNMEQLVQQWKLIDKNTKKLSTPAEQ
jgi:Na+(H+)/acetate symporter ActP